MKKQHLWAFFLFLGIALPLYLPLQAQKKDNKQTTQETETALTVEAVYTMSALYEKSVQSVNWLQSGSFYTALNNNAIVKYDLKTGEAVETWFEGERFHIQVSDYQLGSDEAQILILTNQEPIYRRSYRAVYYLYDRNSKTFEKLKNGEMISYATLSPDGKKVAYVQNNNLFVYDLVTKKETAITKDGKINEIIHGSTDWVYEEEFGFAQAFYWSPDSKKIAYYTFDESQVKEYNMQMWGGKNLYPQDYRFKYPKAGEQNSQVSISIFHLENNLQVKANIGNQVDIYIPRVQWTRDANLLAIRKLDRLQQKLELFHVQAQTGEGALILEEKESTYIDIEYTSDLHYLKNGKQFVMMSERSGYNHLYLYEMNGKLVSQITQGDWEVTKLVGIDEKNEVPVLYFLSTEVSPLERHFYRMEIGGKNKEKLTSMAGYHEVNMSQDFSYYILNHSNTTTPLTVRLFETNTNKELKVLSENSLVLATTEKFGMVKKEIGSFTNSNGDKIYYQMYKPNSIKKKDKLPVLMYVYGGPASQEVKNAWGGRPNDYFHQILVQKGYIVVTIDNRGTEGRGAAFKKATYRNLGKLEVQDQIDGAKFLATLPYVDATRIGVWGWSYGGYMASLLMTLGSDYFKAGIAVAPVTSWRYYDTVYTERFLQRPQDNPTGYDAYSPITHAKKLKGAFLLVHGTGDDNVHFQNAVIFQEALIQANKDFDSFYYPDKNHGLYGGMTRIHLYNKMLKFWLRNL
jgi:dipeptidyl-peptidase-4